MNTLLGKSMRRKARLQQARPARSLGRDGALLLEQLEERAVPTVIFNSPFGGDTIYWDPGNGAGQPANQVLTGPITNNPTALNDPKVYLIFWGQSWTNTTAQKFADDVQTIFNSPFLSGLKDYGSDGMATFGGYTIDNSTAATLGPVVATQEIQRILPTMSSWAKPQLPASPAGSAFWPGAMASPIYVVVFDNGNSGGNGPDDYTPPGSSTALAINHIWIGDGGNNEDVFTDVFSHEIVERMFSGGGGLAMNAQVNISGEWQNAQVSDNEPDGGRYTYRLDGSVLVQAYWSISYNGFIVQDGTTEDFYLSPDWNTQTSPPSFLGNSTLTINGDQLGSSDNDSVVLDLTPSGGVQATLDGQTVQFNKGAISGVDIITKGGDNTVNIDATAPNVPVSIDMLGGNGTVNINPGGEDLGAIQGNVDVTGGNDSDVLNIFDTSNPSQVTYSVTSSTMTRTGAAPISYASLGQVNLYTGQGNNTCNIESTKQGTALSVYGGDGDETFNVTPTAENLDSLQSNVTIAAGGGGSSTLNVDDNTNSQASTWTLSTKSVQDGLIATNYDTLARSGWSYELDFEAPIVGLDTGTNKVVLDGGTGNNTYNIEKTAQGTAVTVQGGTGNNTFNISPTAQNLSNIQGNVAVGGGGGNVALNIFDDSNANPVTYSVTSSTVTRTGAATISYDSLVPTVSLDGGSARDTYDIESSSASTAVRVNGGSGNNTFNISPTAQNLNNIKGDLTINGGLGNNVMNIFDDNNANPVTYSVTSSTVTRTGAATISYSSINSLTLDGGSGNDTYNINGTASGTKLALTAGKGNNAFNMISAAASSSVSVKGGSGNNTLVGPNVASTWKITGADAGNVGNVSFAGIKNLTGGSGVDVFIFSAGESVAGKINGGGGGNDWLDYAAYTTPVAVNLTAGTATGAGGGIANIRNVRGGQGGNTLTGDAQGNILIGGAGANTITGGTGRSILIGGKGKDTITGKSGGDILIAGYTDYDSGSLANDLALESILAEWQSANSYATRISHIKNGGGLNGSNKLAWNVTVHDNSTANANKLTGGGGTSGQNWFFGNLSHTLTNKTAVEQLN